MALKTPSEIAADFYTLILHSCLGAEIRGTIYADGVSRNPDAITEDAVVTFLSGSDSQIQQGVIILNIYVPYLDSMTPDFHRVSQLQTLVYSFLWEDTSDYCIETDTSITVDFQTDIPCQSCLTARLRYSRMAS